MLSVLLAATPPATPKDDAVTPGVIGFLAILLVTVVTILLIVDMIRRIRRLRYRGEVEARRAAAEAESRR